MFQRLRWQVLRRFASCPSCHGLGPYTTVKGDKDKRELAPSKDRAEVRYARMHRSRQSMLEETANYSRIVKI